MQGWRKAWVRTREPLQVTPILPVGPSDFLLAYRAILLLLPCGVLGCHCGQQNYEHYNDGGGVCRSCTGPSFLPLDRSPGAHCFPKSGLAAAQQHGEMGFSRPMTCRARASSGRMPTQAQVTVLPFSHDLPCDELLCSSGKFRLRGGPSMCVKGLPGYQQ